MIRRRIASAGHFDPVGADERRQVEQLADGAAAYNTDTEPVHNGVTLQTFMDYATTGSLVRA